MPAWHLLGPEPALVFCYVAHLRIIAHNVHNRPVFYLLPCVGDRHACQGVAVLMIPLMSKGLARTADSHSLQLRSEVT